MSEICSQDKNSNYINHEVQERIHKIQLFNSLTLFVVYDEIFVSVRLNKV